MSSSDVLFLGRGRTPDCWYRCALPAIFLDADWAGALGTPENELVLVTGGMRRPMLQEQLFAYEIVVIQHARGPGWPDLIEGLRRAGVTVLYDAEGDVHAWHDPARRSHSPEVRAVLRDAERSIAVCDGVIVGSEKLAGRLGHVASRIWICEDGLDLGRFAVTRAPHEGVVLGWAGGPGDAELAVGWLRAIDAVMTARDDVRFVSVGEPYADLLRERHGDRRCLTIPYGQHESFAAAMASVDVALAAPDGSANGDRRWLEAAACGLPVIADRAANPRIEDGVTGFRASTAKEAGALMRKLAADARLRDAVGQAAREHVFAHRDMRVAARSWATVLADVRATSGAARPRRAA